MKITDIIIFEPVDRFLWLMTVFSLLAISFLYLGKAKQRPSRNERTLTIGFAFIFLGLAICRFIIYIGDFTRSGSYKNDDHIFYATPPENLDFMVLNNLGYIVWWFFIIFYYYYFEKATKRKVYAMTFLNIFFLILLFINPSLFLLLSGIDLVITFYFFVRWGGRSSYDVQSDTSFVLMGVVLFWLGFFVEIIGVRQENIIVSSFPAFLFLAGAFLQLSNPIVKQVLFLNSTLFLVAIILSFGILNLNEYYFFVFLIAFVIYTLIVIYSSSRTVLLIKSVELVGFDKNKVGKDDGFDFLKMMGKIKKEHLSEEEITLYKEQRMCLVCKGKKTGFIYLCPDCEAYYCFKCARYIAKLENLCWACESTLDKSKSAQKAKPRYKVPSPVELTVPHGTEEPTHPMAQKQTSLNKGKTKSTSQNKSDFIPKGTSFLSISKRKGAPMTEKARKTTQKKKKEKNLEGMPKTKLCRNCGALNLEKVEHCEKCGYNIFIFL